MGGMKNPGWPTIGRAVAGRMDSLNLSQAELARNAKLSEPTVHGIMIGKPRGEPSRATLRKLSVALGYTTDSIERMLRGQEPRVADDIGGGGASIKDQITAILSKLDEGPSRDELRDKLIALTAEIAETAESVREMNDTMTEVQETVADVRAVTELVRDSLAQATARRSS